jgi:type I pantothenate kinase
VLSSDAGRRFVTWEADDWAAQAPSSPELTGPDLPSPVDALPVDAGEVEAVYRPLASLILRRLRADRSLRRDDGALAPGPDGPLVVGLTGSVAVGKSTLAALLSSLLARAGLDVAVLPTDGFLHRNATLEALGIPAHRKGFPGTYDVDALVAVLVSLARGEATVAVPVYSHRVFDVEGQTDLARPDVLILEGINVLGLETATTGELVSDLVDLTIYVDAAETDIRTWFVARFLGLQQGAVDDESSFYHRWADLDRPAVEELGRAVWDGVNGPNLREHIAPGRTRAQVVVEKGPDHRVRRVRVAT